jgi:dihydroorotate dehydrogenase (NAD+) catalytic subunit
MTDQEQPTTSPDLSVALGRLRLRNPVLVASGTFGYAREMEGIVDFARLGGIIPKTVTRQPRAGNPPPRTVETPSGMLNAIGLDNDGIDHFIRHHLPYLRGLPTSIIANIAGKNEGEFVEMAEQIGGAAGLAALELNLSCPNVAGGVDFATDPAVTARVVRGVRAVCPLPLLAKLTPNVTDIVPVAQAAADAGADAVTLVNTFVGMAVDWRRRRPVLGNGTGGLSGPAIKPLALRLVWQVARKVRVPIVGVGGIATADDVMEFLVAGASAVQLGTVNFYDPKASVRVVDELPAALAQLGAGSVREVVGSLAS